MSNILIKISNISVKISNILVKQFEIPPSGFRIEYLIFVKTSTILIKFQRAFERISYNVRDFNPNLLNFDRTFLVYTVQDVDPNFQHFH